MAGLVLGLVQGLIAYAQGGRWLAGGFLNIQWAYTPAHTASFAAGVAAKRGRWLFSLEERNQTRRGMGPESLAAETELVAILFLGPGDEGSATYGLPTCLAWGACSGPVNVAFSEVLFATARRWADVLNGAMQLLGRAADAFYLTHPNLVFVLAGIWAVVTNAAAGLPPLDW